MGWCALNLPAMELDLRIVRGCLYLERDGTAAHKPVGFVPTRVRLDPSIGCLLFQVMGLVFATATLYSFGMVARE
jgi:hypothetical protein